MRKANGWHSLILIPLLIAFVALILSFTNEIEMWLFDGDVL